MNGSLHDKRFRRKNPPTSIAETEHTIIDGILEPLNTFGLTSHQPMNLPHFHKHSRKCNH